MSSSPGMSELEELSDKSLSTLLEITKTELAEKGLMMKYPDHAEWVRIYHEDLAKELHRRKMCLCLLEIRILHRFQKKNKFWVVRWLKRIKIEQIEPLVLED